MMRTMRENTKWIMLATALAFVALMVFEWGMDITGRSAGVSELGRVNGTPVTYDRYQVVYRNLYDQVQGSQQEPITSQQNREIEDAAWDELVNQILIQQELARRGIRVTDDEIRQAAAFSPLPEFRANPALQTEGSFDLQKYQNYLATLSPQELLLLEGYYREVIPQGKLLRQISSGIFVSDAALWRAYRDQNEQVEVRYISLDPARRITDDRVQIGDDEVRAYYRAHEEEFAVPARATVKVVVLDKAPTAADTTAARERAEAIRAEIQEGADFAELAARESADSVSARDGGSLGTFARGQMVPTFDSAAFAAPLGRVTEPVQTQFGFHLIQVDSRQGDSVTASHILIPVERTDASEIAILTRADSLESLGETVPLEEAAAALGLQVQTVDITEDFPFVVGAGQVGEGADWVFEDAPAPGEVSPVFENAQAYYAMELVSSEPAGVLPLEDAAPAIRQTLTVEKKKAMTLAEAEEAMRQGGGASGLDAIAQKLGVDVATSPPFTRTTFVPGLGRQNAAIGTAFGLSEGEVSGVVDAGSNVVILELVRRIEADRSAWEAQKEEQRQRLGTTIEQQRLQQWLDGLRANARIVDRRREVFRAAEEASDQPQIPMAF